MALILANRVRETSTTTGTGTYTLAGAVAGYGTFASRMANGDTCTYGAYDAATGAWEIGKGTWATGGTLARTTIYQSSNADAAVSWAAGTRQIYMTPSTSGAFPGMRFTAAITPDANDQAALGSASLSWADLFLASGGVIDWANGQVQLIQGGADQLTLTGGGLRLETSTTTVPPIWINTTTLTTTISAGYIERDATNFYGTTDTDNRGIIPVVHYIRAASAQTLISQTGAQPIFDSPANGALTLEAGAYWFDMVFRLTGMSATTGNGQVLFGGTGTFTDWLWWHSALDNTTPANIAADQVGLAVTNASPALIATTGTGTALRVMARGSFECSAGGTWIPQFALTTAVAATVTAGSICRVERIGAEATASVGQWA